MLYPKLLTLQLFFGLCPSTSQAAKKEIRTLKARLLSFWMQSATKVPDGMKP